MDRDKMMKVKEDPFTSVIQILLIIRDIDPILNLNQSIINTETSKII